MDERDMDVDARWIVITAVAYGCASGALTAALILAVDGIIQGEFFLALPLVAAVYGGFFGGILGLLCGVALGAWSGVRTGLGPEARARTFPAVVLVTVAAIGALAWWRVDDSRDFAIWIIGPAIPIAWFGARHLAPRYVRHIASMEARGLLRGRAGPQTPRSN